MKGYYSLGLCGYEVEVINEDLIQWVFVGTSRENTTHRSKVYHTANGRAYFNANGRRIHLDQCLRTNM